MNNRHADSKFYHTMQALGIITFLAFAILAGVLYVRTQATAQERADTKRTFKAVICHIQEASLRQSKSPDQAQQIVKFYTDLLINVVKTTACST